MYAKITEEDNESNDEKCENLVNSGTMISNHNVQYKSSIAHYSKHRLKFSALRGFKLNPAKPDQQTTSSVAQLYMDRGTDFDESHKSLRNDRQSQWSSEEVKLLKVLPLQLEGYVKKNCEAINKILGIDDDKHMMELE